MANAKNCINIWIRYRWKWDQSSYWNFVPYPLIGKCWRHYGQKPNLKWSITASIYKYRVRYNFWKFISLPCVSIDWLNWESYNWKLSYATNVTICLMRPFVRWKINRASLKRACSPVPSVAKNFAMVKCFVNRGLVNKICFFFFMKGRSCCEFNYDLYTRIVPKVAAKKPTGIIDIADLMGAGKAGRKKLKTGGGAKVKGKKRQRSKSPPKKKK